jgi:hypothetical protein
MVPRLRDVWDTGGLVTRPPDRADQLSRNQLGWGRHALHDPAAAGFAFSHELMTGSSRVEFLALIPILLPRPARLEALRELAQDG